MRNITTLSFFALGLGLASCGDSATATPPAATSSAAQPAAAEPAAEPSAEPTLFTQAEADAHYAEEIAPDEFDAELDKLTDEISADEELTGGN